MAGDVVPEVRPERYKPPGYEEVTALLAALKKERQGTQQRIWRARRARRSDWAQVVKMVPSAYKKMLGDVDQPMVRDILQRVVGIIASHPPMPEVVAASIRPSEVEAAAREEARLHALRMTIEDQQDRNVYEMGVDSQCANGESWIAVWPDRMRMPYPLDDEKGEAPDDEGKEGEPKEYRRGAKESSRDYAKRLQKLQLARGVPIKFCDYDPLTVYPMRGPTGIVGAIVETEHALLDVDLGMGLRPVKGEDGKVSWADGRFTLLDGQVPASGNSSTGSSDTTHITPESRQGSGGARFADQTVRKVEYCDPFTYRCFLDGLMVEDWQHNWGIVPIFPAGGVGSSDHDPEWASEGIVDVAIPIVEQIVFFSAVMASSALQHGFPTPFIKNPAFGLVGTNGEPLIRPVKLGQMNTLGPGEDIVFPFLDAKMGNDFLGHMQYLLDQMETYGLSNFGKALNSDIAGYAIAQIRAMQMSKLAPIYTNAARQWRKIFYFLRYLVREVFPGGVYLRGAVEEDEETGQQYRPILEYAKEHTTDYSINVHIDEGIPQDEIAERKSALEMKQNGIWSERRVMEKTGVEDSEKEKTEIRLERLLASPASDQLILAIAQQMIMSRQQAVQQQQQTPLGNAIEQAKQQFMAGGGQFQNQGANPANASPNGTPLNQQPGNGQPQGGPDFGGLGVPAQQPGGSPGVIGGGTPAAVGA